MHLAYCLNLSFQFNSQKSSLKCLLDRKGEMVNISYSDLLFCIGWRLSWDSDFCFSKCQSREYGSLFIKFRTEIFDISFLLRRIAIKDPLTKPVIMLVIRGNERTISAFFITYQL